MKNTITLNEQQLRKVIEESVREVLSELDARTYANYARGREAQGQNYKTFKGRMAATKAWNDKYGRNNSYYNSDSATYVQKYMQNDDYTMHDGYWTNRNDDSHEYFSHKYNPYDDEVEYDNKAVDRFGKTTHYKGTMKGSGYYDDGRDVAKQMARGTGEYVKGKGWK